MHDEHWEDYRKYRVRPDRPRLRSNSDRRGLLDGSLLMADYRTNIIAIIEHLAKKPDDSKLDLILHATCARFDEEIIENNLEPVNWTVIITAAKRAKLS